MTSRQSAVADEQAALRRVAVLVAHGADRQAVLEAIVAEAFELFPVDFTALLRYEPDGAAVIVAVHHGPPGLAVGERAPHIPDGLVLRVLRSAAPTRVDDYAQLPDEGVARMRELGISAGAAAPILVDRRVWGVLTAMTRTGTVEPGLEHTLAGFAEIAATAVASAQARDELRALADEQSALRRIAELAVRGTDLGDVLRAVAVEAAALVGGTVMTLAQYGSDGASVVRATSGDQLVVGRPADDTLTVLLERWRDPGRVEGSAEPTAAVPSPVTGLDGGAVAAAIPIQVEGRVWGVLAATSSDGDLPPGTVRRLAQFADIAAAATSSALARADLRRLADEQAALRQVAETAARDAPPDEVLHEIAVQASHLAGVEFTTVLRYEADGATEIVALSGGPDFLTVGARAPGTGTGAIQRVWRTQRSARIVDLRTVTGQWPEMLVPHGYSTTTAVPILIRGELWGTLIAIGRGAPLSETIEEGLSSFAELASIAVSGAQARGEVRALADEQTAFRRVADLVARGTAPEEVLEVVTAEASQLLGGLPATWERLGPTGVTSTVREAGTGSAPAGGGTDVSVPIVVEDRVWGRLTLSCGSSPVPGRTEERLQQFAELTAVAIANAENKARLVASRARVVATADETRRRLQRDVHDGAQQRLVQTIITLKLARDAAPQGSAAHDRVLEALTHAERANEGLRDLVRGILPASLTHGGLRSGLQSLISEVSVPVRLRLTAPPSSQQVETTAYFIVAEALTNVIKHAAASQADVTVELDGTHLVVTVSDDGVGGADASTGGGLTGLSDRVAAAEGTLTLTSPAGHGTTLRARLPVVEGPR